MATGQLHLEPLGGRAASLPGLALPIAAAAMVLVILLPLPPTVMNVLLLGNIALATVVLLMTIFVAGPLEFSVFPSLLLGTTLLRLVLTIAATRLILTCGADGRSAEDAQLAAGGVLWSFSQLVTAGSLAVGVVLFAIIVMVQFVVVTKGATRISEVAARFVLDALPGRQMAIDADLAASVVTPGEARQRRSQLAREADFYGAMDGASKFLRGDAIAAILVLAVNLLGGLYVGAAQYGWSLRTSAELFTRLTIGAGLAMQIPALIVSVAAALIVSRSNAETDLGKELTSQLTARPAALAITGGLLAVMMLTSLPKVPLLILAGACIALATVLRRRRTPPAAAGVPAQQEAAGQRPAGQKVSDLLAVDAMRIELGFALVGLVDQPEKGALLGRIANLRKRIASQLGVIVPPIRIMDNMEMESRGYAIFIRGAKVAGGRLHPRLLLAISDEHTSGALMGREASEPASGRAAVWISPSQRARAEAMGYAVVESCGVLVTHLEQTIRRHAAELLSRRHVAELLENLKAGASQLVAEVTTNLTLSQIQKVLQNLLREQVSIRDLESILEALADASCQTNRVELLTEQVRSALGRLLCQQFCGRDGKLSCVYLAASLEQELGTYLSEGPPSGAAAIPPEVGKEVSRVVAQPLAELQRQGRWPVVVCAPQIRPAVSKLIAAAVPEAVVLGYNEIDSVEVESVASVGI